MEVAAAAIPDEQEALTAYLKKTVVQSTSFKDQYGAEVWLMSQTQKLEQFIKDPELRLNLLKGTSNNS